MNRPPVNLPIAFGETLREMRERRGLTTQEVDERSQLRRFTSLEVELGLIAYVTIVELYDFARALECHPAELLPVVEVSA